jgi:hypothetical protein
MSLQPVKFINLPYKECLKAFPVVQANADCQFRVAEILAEKKEYSNAVAHLILGTEEL